VGRPADRAATPLDRYAHGHHDSVLRSHRWRTVANSAAYLIDDLRPGLDVIDVGCGPGSITIDLAARVAPGRVVGVDRSEAPLDEARALAGERGVSNVAFEVADVSALPHADATFDVVHAHQLLQHVPDPVAALREMRRVCRPGGIVAARDVIFGATTWYPDDPGLDRWLALQQATMRAIGTHPDGGRRLHAWARAAGFGSIRSSATAWCFSTPDERAWWGGLWAERVTVSGYADHAIAHGLTPPAELEAIAAAWRRWAAADDGWMTVLSGEIRCQP